MNIFLYRLSDATSSSSSPMQRTTTTEPPNRCRDRGMATSHEHHVAALVVGVVWCGVVTGDGVITTAVACVKSAINQEHYTTTKQEDRTNKTPQQDDDDEDDCDDDEDEVEVAGNANTELRTPSRAGATTQCRTVF